MFSKDSISAFINIYGPKCFIVREGLHRESYVGIIELVKGIDDAIVLRPFGETDFQNIDITALTADFKTPTMLSIDSITLINNIQIIENKITPETTTN
jgi:hypothetical protein